MFYCFCFISQSIIKRALVSIQPPWSLEIVLYLGDHDRSHTLSNSVPYIAPYTSKERERDHEPKALRWGKTGTRHICDKMAPAEVWIDVVCFDSNSGHTYFEWRKAPVFPMIGNFLIPFFLVWLTTSSRRVRTTKKPVMPHNICARQAVRFRCCH